MFNFNNVGYHSVSEDSGSGGNISGWRLAAFVVCAVVALFLWPLTVLLWPFVRIGFRKLLK